MYFFLPSKSKSTKKKEMLAWYYFNPSSLLAGQQVARTWQPDIVQWKRQQT